MTLDILPPTSLLISSRDRPELLRETVVSVLAGQELPAEIVIVDQSAAQNDALAAMPAVRGCAIRYIWSRSAGLSRSRNLAVAAARHAILAFADDDMFAAPGWYGALIRALIAAGPRAAVTGRVLAAPMERPGGYVPSLVVSDTPAAYRGRLGCDVLAAGNMALYRAALDEVRGFDERLGAGSRFPAAEDNDLGFRLLEAGYCIRYVPEAVLYHRAWRPSGAFLPLRWRYGRGQGAFYGKHLRLRDTHMAGRLHHDVMRHVVQGVRRAGRLQREAAGDAVFVLGLLAGAIEWTWNQRRTA
jgi:GT2 family glycosyltransferase